MDSELDSIINFLNDQEFKRKLPIVPNSNTLSNQTTTLPEIQSTNINIVDKNSINGKNNGQKPPSGNARKKSSIHKKSSVKLTQPTDSSFNKETHSNKNSAANLNVNVNLNWNPNYNYNYQNYHYYIGAMDSLKKKSKKKASKNKSLNSGSAHQSPNKLHFENQKKSSPEAIFPPPTAPNINNLPQKAVPSAMESVYSEVNGEEQDEDEKADDQNKSNQPYCGGAPALWMSRHVPYMNKRAGYGSNLNAKPGAKKRRTLKFRTYVDPINIRPYLPPDNGYYFKFYTSDVKLIRYTLEDNGFREATSSKQEWTLMWSTSSMKSQVYQSLFRYQKVNHFPKTGEITRKDCMYRNLARMQTVHGARHFDFVPATFILPHDQCELQEEMEKDRNQWWIAKPSSSSQGKGIFVTNKFHEIPSKQSMIVSHYIDNPMLINGYKFDLRIYIAITCVNPLRIYMFEEGLVRFATCKYTNSTNASKANRFMHLTNYSVNKNNANFISNKDPLKDDVGSKWSITALKKFFKDHNINDEVLWKKIEDISIKTILSIDSILNNATEMFVPYRNSCFDILGFDILIDDALTPWLLETNLSPSLNCDSPLDQKIKAEMIANLFTLIGIVPLQERNLGEHSNKKNGAHYQVYAPNADTRLLNTIMKKPQKRNPIHTNEFDTNPTNLNKEKQSMKPLTKFQKMIIKETEDEYKRRGKFIRIFPSINYGLYKQFFEEDRPLNALIASRLFKQVNQKMRTGIETPKDISHYRADFPNNRNPQNLGNHILHPINSNQLQKAKTADSKKKSRKSKKNQDEDQYATHH